MNGGERFFRQLWQGTAPLLLWAAHFFFCYLVAAAGCRPHTWTVLLGATLVALGGAGAFAWRAWRSADRVSGMVAVARRWSAILACAAIAWSALPLLVFGACR